MIIAVCHKGAAVMKEREEALVRGSGLIPLLVGGLLGCVLVICIVVVILVVWRHRRSKSDGMSVAMYACISYGSHILVTGSLHVYLS